MTPTIKPHHYGRIAHQHNRVALTARALGDTKLEERERRMRDVTLARAHNVRDKMRGSA